MTQKEFRKDWAKNTHVNTQIGLHVREIVREKYK